MPGGLLITPAELSELIADDRALVFDCRFDLFHPAQGRNSWLAAHVPGAVYADLDEHLSGRVSAQSGRHPLPAARSFAAFLACSGWTKDKQIVAYDAHGGAVAARLWWLVRYFGLGEARLLDGGIGAWMSACLPMESGPVHPARGETPVLEALPDMTASANGLLDALESGEALLLDVRSPERFSGQSEPIDTVAGHVPGAINHPVEGNLGEDGLFLPPNELKAVFRQLLGKQDPASVICMCGSGVTACQALFAMELAGLEKGRLYVGSWSEWIRDARRPIVQGATPG